MKTLRECKVFFLIFLQLVHIKLKVAIIELRNENERM